MFSSCRGVKQNYDRIFCNQYLPDELEGVPIKYQHNPITGELYNIKFENPKIDELYKGNTQFGFRESNASFDSEISEIPRNNISLSQSDISTINKFDDRIKKEEEKNKKIENSNLLSFTFSNN